MSIDTLEMILKITDLYPGLKDQPPGLVKSYYELFARYAPIVASELLMVAPLVNNAVIMKHIDLDALAKLCDVECELGHRVRHLREERDAAYQTEVKVTKIVPVARDKKLMWATAIGMIERSPLRLDFVRLLAAWDPKDIEEMFETARDLRLKHRDD